MNLTSRLIVLASIAGLFVWLFADALFGSGMFVFRDAAHYYYPLFQLIQEEWAAGRVPLWNPYENLGQPLAGNAASSVFYPGKLIFALPLDYAWAYKIYIMAHLLLAAWGAFRLARHFKASTMAAGVCAISYAFSGNVLFDYCNVVFLVGAAWLPLAMLAADRMLNEERGARGEGRGDKGASGTGRPRGSWAVGFGVVLALMVLGGDPQMAYNAGLLAAIYALWLWWDGSPLSLWERVRVRVKQAVGCVKRTRKRTRKQGAEKKQEPSGSRLVRCTHPTRPALLALAAATGLALSAVQVLPSMEFTALSGRVAARTFGGLVSGRIEPGTHSEHTYQFGVGPWRMAEYVWPNVSGRQFPSHRRWLAVIPAEQRTRVWTPSLYMGLLPLLLALAAMRFRRRNGRGSDTCPSETRVRWLSWMVVLAVVASFGEFGFGWLIREIRYAACGDAGSLGPIGDPFGGLYWLMTVVLPGYAYFRYPAKLLVVAALGLSVLAARGWDRTFTEPSKRFRGLLLCLGVLSLCGAIAAAGLGIWPRWHGWLARVRPDVLFGPLDTVRATNDLLWAFGQTAVLCGLFWWLLRKRGQDSFLAPTAVHTSANAMAKNSSDPFFSAVALVLVAVDLAVANRWMVVCAPASQWTEQSKLAAVLQRTEKGPVPFSQPYRVSRHPIWMRPAWRSNGSPTRMAEAMQWERDTLWPKYNLASRISVAEVQGAMMLYDYETFLRAGNAEKKVKKGRSTFSLPSCLAKYVILPGDKVLSGAERIDVDVEDVSLWRNPEEEHLPRAWIVRQPDVLPPDTESCRVVYYDPSRVEIEAELTGPGLVVLCDQFYPGWKLEVDGVSTPIQRTNRVMRGVWLPAGDHRLTYRYRPASFLCGAIISGLGWIGIGLGLGWHVHKRRTGNRCSTTT